MNSINFKFSFLALVFILLRAATTLSVQSSEKITSKTESSVEIKITGMTCAGCASHVYKVLSETDGVIDNEVKYPGDIAVIKFDASKITSKELVAAIEKDTNYKAELVETKENK